MPAVTMTSVAQESSAARETCAGQGEAGTSEHGTTDMALLRARVAHNLAQVFGLSYVDAFPPALDEILDAEQTATVEAAR